MKKILSLTLALLLVLALTACGTSQMEATSKPASEPESTPPAASEAEPAATVIPDHQQKPSEPENQEQEELPMDTAKRVRFLVGGDEIIVRLEDNPAADSLYEMLPMELRFEDYNGTEKIAYPDETLTTDGAPDHCTPQRGDLCFYAPWGNLCFFYRDFRESPSLVPLGTIEAGIEYLEALDSAASVTAEAVK